MKERKRERERNSNEEMPNEEEHMLTGAHFDSTHRLVSLAPHISPPLLLLFLLFLLLCQLIRPKTRVCLSAF